MPANPHWITYPLMGTIWKTKNSRFNASDRLRRRQWWKNAALSIMSAYLVGLSIAPKYLANQIVPTGFDYLGFVPVLASILLLAMSVMSAFDEDGIRSRYLHDNAKHLSDLYHDFKTDAVDHEAGLAPRPDPTDYQKRYKSIMALCPYNHDPIDYERTVIDIKKDEGAPTLRSEIVFAVKSWIDAYLWPLLVIVSIPVLFLWLI